MKYLIFDTETTGLNIRTDKPFIVPYMVVDSKFNEVSRDIFKIEETAKYDAFKAYVKQIDTIVGHNVGYDVNMMLNVGMVPEDFKDKNYIDTQTLARLVIDADTQTDNTFRIGLKALAVKYLGIDSNQEEKQLKAELSHLTIAHKNEMNDYFVSLGLPKLNTKELNEVYNNWEKVYHKYPNLKSVRKDYFNLHRAPNYSDVSNVAKYAMTDVELTHKLFKKWYPEIVKLEQVPALKRISEATFPYIMMERKGMTVDIKQLLADRNEVLKEKKSLKLFDPRDGSEVSIGQHAKLKEIYEYETGLQLNSADKQTRSEIEDQSPTARKANIIAQVDKYLTTYITRILRDLTFIDGEYKVFTQYNLAGTVTGRLSSNFQQFPKGNLELTNGYVVDIRKWFVVPKQHKYMFYFDYSQMEMRLQCEWTNIVNGEPDMNLARAFSPYKCVDIDGVWYLEEDPTIEWKPTDLHTLTAKHAFPGVDESDPEWSKYRSLGKRANFACNYGAAAPKIAASLKVDLPTARALVSGYNTSFSGVVAFGKWLKNRVYTVNNTPNLLLRRYYSRNKHKLQNWLVQGSGADILLLKTRELYNYIQDKPHWNLMISVHDEIGLTCDDIPKAQLDKEVYEIKNLMTHKMSAVDVTVDVEWTTTTWSDKEDY